MNKFERRLPWILAGLGIILLLSAIAQVTTSLPPRSFTFLTGREGGAYYLGGQLYQKVAARDGFTANLVPTAGSVEALHMLEEGKGDVAFIQGGIAAQGDPDKVSALATVGYEPLWIFYRKDLASAAPLESPQQLQGKRLAIGEAGSGTNQLTRLILADYGINAENTSFQELSSSAALAGLQDGTVDAAFLVANTVAPILNDYLQDASLELMSLSDADALARRHRFLSVLDLPRGTLDLVDVRPRENVKLLSTVANLVIRNDLHPDIVRLLAFAAVELHSPGGFFAARNVFPDTNNTDLPVSKEGETYLLRVKNREFTLDRYLPFWLSAMFDRYLLFVVPLLLIALPLLARSPLLYHFYMRRKVNRWYKEVYRIDQTASEMNLDEVNASIAELEQLDDKLVRELALPNSYLPDLYTLRTNVGYVIARLQKRAASLAPAAAAEEAT